MPLRRIAPKASLLVELEEVAEAANNLAVSLSQSNIGDDDFPKAELLDIVGGLAELKNGTAEGCRIPLEYARSRLPAIRRQYFRRELSDTSPLLDDSYPYRGMHLDRRVGDLISSVVTALDEYRKLSGAGEDEFSLEDDVDLAVPHQYRNTISALSSEIGIRLERDLRESNSILREESDAGDKFKRQIVDAKNLTTLNQAELGMGSVFVRWIKTFGSEIKKAPRLIRRAGQAIQVSVDVILPLSKRWSSFWSNLEEFVLKELKDLGAAIEEVGDRLEKGRKRDKIGSDETKSDNVSEIDKLKMWIKDTIIERKGESIGIPETDVMTAIQYKYRCSPNSLAKRLGHKRIRSITTSIDGIYRIKSSRGVIYTNEHTEEYSRITNENLVKFKEKFNLFKEINPSVTISMVKKWIKLNYGGQLPILPASHSTNADILVAEGYRQVGGGKWELQDSNGE